MTGYIIAALLLIAVAGALAYYFTRYRPSLICSAAAQGDLKRIKELLEKSPRMVSLHDALGRTPLHWAVEFNHMETCMFLVSQGAEINARTRDNRTPLHIAVLQNRREILEYLLELKPDLTIKTIYGRTPLAIAVELSNTVMENILRQHGAEE